MYYFLNIAENPDSGLCNQIYNMAGMLEYAFQNKIKYLFINKFLKQIYTQDFCNASEIFDLKKMNKYFSKKYNVYFFDGNAFAHKIKQIIYSNENGSHDITQIVLNKYSDLSDNIFIPKNQNLSGICSFDVINSFHNIQIYYSIDDYDFTDKYFITPFYISNADF